jgi:hypothetical protein
MPSLINKLLFEKPHGGKNTLLTVKNLIICIPKMPGGI